MRHAGAHGSSCRTCSKACREPAHEITPYFDQGIDFTYQIYMRRHGPPLATLQALPRAQRGIALPNVASDPVVPRPLRPESGSGRAGAPKPSESFEGMLETTSEAPRPARTERASRNHGAERAKATPNSTKPAEAPTARQAKNGQPSVAAEAKAQLAEATTAVAEIPSVPAIEFAIVVEALADGTACEAAPETKDTETTAATDQNADAGAPDISIAAEAAVIDVALPVVAAAVAPGPATVTARAAPPTIDPAAVAAIDLEAAPAAPVKTAPQAPADPIDVPAADSAKPQATPDTAVEASLDQTAPRDESQKAAALKAAISDDASETKSPTPADHKSESPRPSPSSMPPHARLTRRHRAMPQRPPIPRPSPRHPPRIIRRRKPPNMPHPPLVPHWRSVPNCPRAPPRRRSSMPAPRRPRSRSPCTIRCRRSLRSRRCGSTRP